MKKIIVSLFSVMFLCIIVSNITHANDTTVPAEKVWKVKLSQAVLNEEDNFSDITVTDANGEIIDIDIQVSPENATILEVSATTYFDEGVYTLIVPAGLKAVSGMSTTKDVTKTFVVNAFMDNQTLNGKWHVNYTHNGKYLEIDVVFLNSTSEIVVTVPADKVSYNGKEVYSVREGYLNMPITDLKLVLDGKLGVYSEDKFKVTTKTGKYAYFNKVK